MQRQGESGVVAETLWRVAEGLRRAVAVQAGHDRGPVAPPQESSATRKLPATARCAAAACSIACLATPSASRLSSSSMSCGTWSLPMGFMLTRGNRRSRVCGSIMVQQIGAKPGSAPRDRIEIALYLQQRHVFE